jgi:hypothetical protein
MPDDGPAGRADDPAPAAVVGAVGAGTSWFARDAERHLLDAPRHCPRCGAGIGGPGGLVVELWAADDRVFYCWCRSCDWTGTVVQVDRHIGHEAAD